MKDKSGSTVVLAGPGSYTTIPGIIVSEIAMALANTTTVRKIEVDLGRHAMVGLHRAPSLAAAHGEPLSLSIGRHQAPQNAGPRKRAFREWISPDAKVAVAYAWPGIDNDWIRDYLQVAKSLRVPTVVLCASLPISRGAHAASLVNVLRKADRVVVGDIKEATELSVILGSYRPEVQSHRALSLTGRQRHAESQRLTAFLPGASGDALSAVMAAFDAIPENRISNYNLQIVTRHNGSAFESVVANSFHARYVNLIEEDLSASQLRELCDTSSAIGIVAPNLDSRAFSVAIASGVATVVLAKSELPIVGRGYVGGLMADEGQPSSIHVALTHALRLDELGFPHPDGWRDLAERIVGSTEPQKRPTPSRAPKGVTLTRSMHEPERVPALQSSTKT